jgi:hypothetical protein
MKMQMEVIDKFGRVRRLRPGECLADGERLHVPYAFMDANALAARDALAAKHGQHTVRDADAEAATRRRGYRRGFQALEQLLPTRDSSEAASAYEEKRKRLESSRRTVSDGTPADAQAAAAEAYESKRAHLRDAWRGKQKDTNAAAAPSAQDARAVADRAYEDRKARLANAWKR